jgi:pilus assembly protein CpaF
LRDAVVKIGSAKDAPVSVAPERLIELARDELLEFGPLGDLMADGSVSEIGVVRFDQVVAARAGRAVAVEPGFSSERALGWAIARLRADALEGGNQFEFRISSGARVSVDSSASGRPAALLVRRPERLTLTLDELVRRGVISRAIATFFRHCLVARVNVLVVGGHDGSAEQLLSALVGSQADARSVWIGDGVAGQAEVAVDFGLGTLADARRALSVKSGIPGVRFAARLTTPEVTAAVTEMVASGVDGVLALRHATSIKRALLRLAAEIAAARPGLGIRATRELLAGAYDVVVEVARLRDDRVRVLRIVELTGVAGDEIELQDIFTFIPDRTAAGGAVEGTFAPSGSVPQVVEAMRARGENLDSSLFSRPPSR